MKTGDILTVTVDDLAFGGKSLSRLEGGFILFIDGRKSIIDSNCKCNGRIDTLMIEHFRSPAKMMEAEVKTTMRIIFLQGALSTFRTWLALTS